MRKLHGFNNVFRLFCAVIAHVFFYRQPYIREDRRSEQANSWKDPQKYFCGTCQWTIQRSDTTTTTVFSRILQGKRLHKMVTAFYHFLCFFCKYTAHKHIFWWIIKWKTTRIGFSLHSQFVSCLEACSSGESWPKVNFILVVVLFNILLCIYTCFGILLICFLQWSSHLYKRTGSEQHFLFCFPNKYFLCVETV